jgi:hypothetical protein
VEEGSALRHLHHRFSIVRSFPSTEGVPIQTAKEGIVPVVFRDEENGLVEQGQFQSSNSDGTRLRPNPATCFVLSATSSSRRAWGTNTRRSYDCTRLRIAEIDRLVTKNT